MIHDRVEAARRGENPYVITRMPSGWAVMGDVQPVPGYTLLLPDPVVAGINDLEGAVREQYLRDMVRLGDGLLACTDAYRINYEILGNTEQALHAHVTARYEWEEPKIRAHPAFVGYDWKTARRFDPEADGALRDALRDFLSA